MTSERQAAHERRGGPGSPGDEAFVRAIRSRATIFFGGLLLTSQVVLQFMPLPREPSAAIVTAGFALLTAAELVHLGDKREGSRQ